MSNDPAALVIDVPEFDCVDCGTHVFLCSGPPVPEPARCAECACLSRVSDVVERAAMRAFLRHIDDIEGAA
jgi:hypothetical protein